MTKDELLAAGAISVGKAKTLWPTVDPDILMMEFRDDTSAFDGEKVAALDRKGFVNNRFNAFIMQHLEQHGIPTHFIRLRDEPRESAVYRMDMFPVECVVRNYAAGSFCKRYGIEEGRVLNPPTFEYFLKNDELHDPMINESFIQTMDLAGVHEMGYMQTYTMHVNRVLSQLFRESGLLLVDFKLEFGRKPGGGIALGDEFTPDGCRLWDTETMKKMDKDRFRHGMGGVIEAYEEVASRIGVNLD